VARRKSNFKGYALIAGFIGVGVYFHEQITAQFNKVKGALHVG
jgi:hypothetical protein